MLTRARATTAGSICILSSSAGRILEASTRWSVFTTFVGRASYTCASKVLKVWNLDVVAASAFTLPFPLRAFLRDRATIVRRAIGRGAGGVVGLFNRVARALVGVAFAGRRRFAAFCGCAGLMSANVVEVVNSIAFTSAVEGGAAERTDCPDLFLSCQ